MKVVLFFYAELINVMTEGLQQHTRSQTLILVGLSCQEKSRFRSLLDHLYNQEFQVIGIFHPPNNWVIAGLCFECYLS